MARLEEVRSGVKLLGVVPDCPVHIVAVEWLGQQAVQAVYRLANGKLDDVVLYREDEGRLSIADAEEAWCVDTNGGLFRLATEATRIRLAHHFDPYLSINTSPIDPLPHQISAVYGEMLKKHPLRFLLADDPGAGKTVMAGLLTKELIARGDVERCLVVAPGGLVEQWQDELQEKFGLEFILLHRHMLDHTRFGNPFDEHKFLIARLDLLARNDALQSALLDANDWDLIICDEAHRMSATYYGKQVKYTKRYQLGHKLGHKCRHLLLLTATPHNGKDADFRLFLALLDNDRFEGKYGSASDPSDYSDLIRRLTKEELRHFDGRPLFPERRAYTVKYELSHQESELYEAVTAYVRNEMNRVKRFIEGDAKKGQNIGFALQVLQRRLASSPAAIHQSLKRRRIRLEGELATQNLQSHHTIDNHDQDSLSIDELQNIEELSQEEIEQLEDSIVATTSTAETKEQLRLEVDTLRKLESMAATLIESGHDEKWRQLNQILDIDLMSDNSGQRRKLIVFTEARDTLHYISEKIQTRLGGGGGEVAVIHGGIPRDQRRDIIERFMQDPTLLVLVANDAAGEGVNLHRAHLMINYDLPWNPNRLEQRFGRIHRIGQTEVCHLWNLVASNTREGEIYGRLLEKLESARQSLGGRVYNVLGELFVGASLRDLLVEAVCYGEREDVRSRLFETVDGAVDRDRLLELLSARALTYDSLSVSAVRDIRQHMERTLAQRLQPHHIQSFFLEAFKHVNGRLRQREPGRWQLIHVPLRVRNWTSSRRGTSPIQTRYERICFEKNKVHNPPMAQLMCPGHPVLDSIVEIIGADHGPLMSRGAVLVDECDSSTQPATIFLVHHSVRDGRSNHAGSPTVLSERIQFVRVDQDGRCTNAGPAPHLNLRACTKSEVEMISSAMTTLSHPQTLEDAAIRFAALELAPTHLQDVRTWRIPALEKEEREVNAQLRRGINHWDASAIELKRKSYSGEQTRLSWQNAERKADELTERLCRRRKDFVDARNITSLPPRLLGKMLVIPLGLLQAMVTDHDVASASPTISSSADARKAIEIAAMDAVMATETSLGNVPRDVSDQKLGYDIESIDAIDQSLRFIEVKGRIQGARSVMLTRQEIITSLHEPNRFILAIVEVDDGTSMPPRYIRGALTEHEPSFEQTGVQFDIRRLLGRSESPT